MFSIADSRGATATGIFITGEAPRDSQTFYARRATIGVFKLSGCFQKVRWQI